MIEDQEYSSNLPASLPKVIDISLEKEDSFSFPRRQSRKKRSKSWATAALLSACIVVSALSGFAGGYVAERMRPGGTSSRGATEVLYQTVIRNVAAGDTSADKMMSVAEVAAIVKQTVVEITTETVLTNGRMRQFVTEGAGSGVIIGSDGYVVTNNHVVSGASNIMVRLCDGSEYAATLVGRDSKTDLAVLKIDATGLTPAVLGDSGVIAVGDTAVAVGNPLGELGGTVTSGIISALDREITIDGEPMTLLQTDAAINPGNSGGGLFNLYGELIGVVNAKSSGSDIEGLGFAIPINTAKTVAEDIIKYGYVRGRINTGLTLVDITSVQLAMMYRVNQTGLYISASTNSELKSGDRITAVDGKTISNFTSFSAVMNTHHVGDKVSLTVVRGGQSLTISLTLTEMTS